MNKFDRYTIIKSLVYSLDRYEQDIVQNSLLTYEQREHQVQINNSVIQGIIDRLIDEERSEKEK